MVRMMHTNGTNVNKKVAQGASTRASLLLAGRRLFGASGYADTSMDDIAAAAEVTKGALYHHFRGKDDLFRAVYEQVKREITEQVAPSFLLSDPFEALLAGCRATLAAHMDPEIRQIVLFDGRAVLGWETAREIDARYGALVLRGALRRAMKLGLIERQPRGPRAQMRDGALAEACVLIADAPDGDAALAEVDSIIARLLRGLRPSAG